MAIVDYVMCARSVKGSKFTAEPGATLFLQVPDGDLPKPSQAIDKDTWAKKVIAESRRKSATGEFGNILIFVHGYNNDAKTIMQRHRMLRDDLAAAKFSGIVVSFDWPSGDKGLLYLEDRIDAKKTALQLVTDGISTLARFQAPDCLSNMHILAHSTGAYVVREAFDDADDRQLATQSWMVSQLMFIGGDVSAGSMSTENSSSESVYRHCTRLTNYSNRHDSVLALSNAKRVGLAPRVGRVGLPNDVPDKAVNVDCSAYWEANVKDKQTTTGNPSHSWHFGNPIFTADMISVMNGIDRESMPTRKVEDGQIVLVG